MKFINGWFFFGVVISMESMRRTYVGGASLSLFIIKSYGLDRQAADCLRWLRKGLRLMGGEIERVPWLISWIAAPYLDYVQSGETFIKIIDILKDLQRPPGCELYWGKEDLP